MRESAGISLPWNLTCAAPDLVKFVKKISVGVNVIDDRGAIANIFCSSNVSDPAIGCDRYGLTVDGRQQVSAAVSDFTDALPTVIVCSDFLRTRQTAELAAKGFGIADPVCDIGLRERYFGIWEGQSDRRYPQVWADDQLEVIRVWWA